MVTIKITIIRTDGREEAHDVGKHIAMDWIERMINAKALDTVNLNRVQPGKVMLVDDDGWDCETVDHGNGHLEFKPIRARKPINEKATQLYQSVCRPGTTHQIAGDVAIATDKDFA